MTCVVQARMGSVRLPGKVLADLGGLPLLAFLLRRLVPVGADHVVVATTDRPGDDPVEEVARVQGAEVVRGPEDDVLSRFALALDAFPADAVVRITADCPLADPALVTRALRVWRETGADYVSNTLVRTYPDGLDVEVVGAAALRAAAAGAQDPVEREHVTPYVYRRPERFVLRSFRHPLHHEGPLGDLRWTVDTASDLELVRGIVRGLGRVDFAWEEALAFAPRPQSPPDGFSLVPAGPGDAEVVLALRNDPDSVRWSVDPRPVDPERHREWFASVLENPATRVWVARRHGEPVGLVRFEVEDGIGEIGIAVDPAARRDGVATRMLAELTEALAADEQVHTFVARVHRDNEASLRLFERAAFTPAGRNGDFLVLRRDRRGPS